MRNWGISKSALRKATSIPRGTLPRKRDIARATNIMNKRIREPVPASKRKEAFERAKNKCQYPRCNEKEILDIHHKNMNPEDNRLSNLEVLCPTHHRKRHKEKKRIDIKDMTGRRVKSLVVKRKPRATKKKKIGKKKHSNPYGFNIKMPKLDIGI